MGIIGFGLGIMFVGLLCLLRVWVEYGDVVARSTAVGEQIYAMAMGLVQWGLVFGLTLLGIGAIFVVIGVIYIKKKDL